jgi:large subunit ribosomal protein L25
MLELSADLRQETGRKNKQIREQGLIPAILYGHKVKNLTLLVKTLDFERAYQEAGESTLIKLKINTPQKQAEKERIVLIHQVAKNPVSDKIIHIDFYQVKMDEPIKVEVPLVFVGQSPAVKETDGVLIKSIQSLEVEALPQDLPHQIEVDISSLKTFDDNIYIKNLELPPRVKIEAQAKEVVASVIPPRTKAELEALEQAPEEKIEEVKVEAEEKAKEEVEETAEEKTKEPTSAEKESGSGEGEKGEKTKGGNE